MALNHLCGSVIGLKKNTLWDVSQTGKESLTGNAVATKGLGQRMSINTDFVIVNSIKLIILPVG